MTTNKNEKFSRNFSDGRGNLINKTDNELLNITKLHKVSDIENNIFNPTTFLGTIISDLEILEKRVEVMEKLFFKALALGVAIEENSL